MVPSRYRYETKAAINHVCERHFTYAGSIAGAPPFTKKTVELNCHLLPKCALPAAG